jgi:hypothetical protein
MCPEARIVVRVVSRHLDELEFLWGQYRGARRSPEYVAADLSVLEGRIESHLDALRVAGDGITGMLGEKLSQEDANAAFTAASVLLRSNRDDLARTVTAALMEAAGTRLEGIKEALCQTQTPFAVKDLRDVFMSPRSVVAVAAAEVLAFQARMDPMSGRLAELLADSDPSVRRAAWRVVAILDSTGSSARS